MRQLRYIFILTVTLISCNQKGSKSYYNEDSTFERLSFKNVLEVVQDSKSNAWVELKDNSASLALFFNLGVQDTLCVMYTTECWIFYPIKIENDKIIIYWDNYIDSKYDFDIVKAIKKIDKKHLGEPFMILELANDTTLTATYPIQEIVTEINNSSKNRTLFTTKYNVTNEYY